MPALQSSMIEYSIGMRRIFYTENISNLARTYANYSDWQEQQIPRSVRPLATTKAEARGKLLKKLIETKDKLLGNKKVKVKSVTQQVLKKCGNLNLNQCTCFLGPFKVFLCLFVTTKYALDLQTSLKIASAFELWWSGSKTAATKDVNVTYNSNSPSAVLRSSKLMEPS